MIRINTVRSGPQINIYIHKNLQFMARLNTGGGVTTAPSLKRHGPHEVGNVMKIHKYKGCQASIKQALPYYWNFGFRLFIGI